VPFADAMLVPLPAGVSAVDAASVSCNVTDAYRSVAALAGELPGARVLVASGAFRNIAMYSVVIARALGAAGVDFLDPDPAVRARATALGARVLETPEEIEDGAYPITVDASMDPALLVRAIHATAPAGMCTASTMYLGDATPLPLFTMFQRCVTFRTGQPDVRKDMAPVLELLASRRLDLSSVTDAIVDWEEAPAAFRRGQGKVVCVRQDRA
jgi:alcohol dehydrogenase